MGAIKLKEDELKRIAESISSSDDRRQMMQKLNGLCCGLGRRHGFNSERVVAIRHLIEVYK